jgi:4-amino-4-deoxy-L-arabinose transferase-like glycosyltransferase
VKSNIQQKQIIYFALVTFFAAGLFGSSMFMNTGGHVVAPLDDTYIHFQYAKRLSEGHFFDYTEGSGFSTGATSVLYPFLLAPFMKIGFSGARILIITFLLGAFCFFLSSILIFLIGKKLANENAAFLAAFLFLVNGNIAWNYFSGMETGFFATLLLGAFYFITIWWTERKPQQYFLAFTLLGIASITRPEGFFILLLCIIFVIARARRIHASRAFLILFALLPFIIFMMIVRFKTASFETSGILAKSVTAAPYYSFWEKIAKLVDNFSFIFNAYYSNSVNCFFPDGAMSPGFPSGALYPFLLFPPAALIIAITGIVLGGARERNTGHSGPVILLALSLLFSLILITNSEVVAAHYFRYLAPFQPIFLILFSLGVFEISRLFQARATRAFRIASVIMIILIMPSLFYWAYIYGENGNDLFEQHRRCSWWIKDAVPEDSVVGVTDTGIIGYFSNRRIYDFVGLTTPDQANHWREGLGSAFERLEHLPRKNLPDYIVSFPFVWGDNNFLGKPVFNSPLRKNITTMSKDFVVYKQDWSMINTGNFPAKIPIGFSLVDSLDVADLQDESLHNYKNNESYEREVGWAFPNKRNFYHSGLINKKSIADGGREISGRESFIIRLKPGKDARMIVRTESHDQAAVIISVNGKEAGTLSSHEGLKAKWQELSLLITADKITNENKIEVIFDRDRSKTRSFRSFHYWFYQ